MTDEDIFKNVIEKTEDLLQDYNNVLLAVEMESTNKDIVNELFRVMHTIKGNVVIVGLDEVRDIAHACEDVLGAIRSSFLRIDDVTLPFLWSGIRLIRERLSLSSDADVAISLTEEEREFFDRNKDLLRTAKENEEKETAQRKIIRKYEYHYNAEDVTPYVESVISYIVSGKEATVRAGDTDAFLEALTHLEGVFKQKRNYSAVSTIQEMQSNYEMMVDDEGLPSRLLLQILEESFVSVVREFEKTEERTINNTVRVSLKRQRSAIRIEQGRIEAIEKDIGYLENTRKKIHDLLSQDGETSCQEDVMNAVGRHVTFFEFVLNDMKCVLNSVQRASPQLLLRTLNNMLVSLAETCNKKVVIETTGYGVTIDMLKMEALEKTLIHIARNSIDHGIESEEERRLQGKPPEGKISINIFDDDGYTTITISDDGRGIDFESVKKNAVQAGAVTQDELDDYSYTETEKLLFMPGVTTATSVGTVSGRGIGMNAVQKLLEDIGATITVSSQLHEGTVFTIRVPNEGDGM